MCICISSYTHIEDPTCGSHAHPSNNTMPEINSWCSRWFLGDYFFHAKTHGERDQ